MINDSLQQRLFGAICICSATWQAVAGTNFTFAPPTDLVFPAEHFPTHIAAADFDDNGTLDLVLPGRDTEGLVYTLPGNGDGTFGEFQSFMLDFQTDWVEVNDFNNDDIEDLALAARSSNGRVAVLFGVGDGTFTDATEYHVGRETRGLASADFDGDGDIDLAGLTYQSASVTILLNSGQGQFNTTQTLRMNEYVGGLAYPQQISEGDLDNDGDVDLVVTAVGARRINVLLNHGDGTFDPEISYLPPDFSDENEAVTQSALGDINGDGSLDIVSPLILTSDDQEFSVLVNDGQADFNEQLHFPASSLGISWTPALGDLDGDGDLDVIIGYGLPGPIVLIANQGGDPVSFGEPQEIELGNFTRFILPADLDSDGDIDLVAAQAPSDTITVLLNETPQQSHLAGGSQSGEAALQAVKSGSPATPADKSRPALPSQDFNNDGRINSIDLAIQIAAEQ